jgi:hypothetical protein
MDPTPAVGRPPHVPTDDSRRTVELMTMAGITQEGVARVLDISVDTLGRHYRTELDTSVDKAWPRAGAATRDRRRSSSD